MAMGSVSARGLADSLIRENVVPELYTVGDCASPRKTLHAMMEAAEVSYGVCSPTGYEFPSAYPLKAIRV